MKKVGVREFRDHATTYLAGDEVLAIERHGDPIGFYIPARAPRPAAAPDAFDRLERAVDRVLTETGFSEAELLRFFDLSQPEVKEALRDNAAIRATGR